MKTCPKCLTQIPAAAKVCASCQHEFRSSAENAFRFVLVIGLAIVAVIIFLALFGKSVGL